MCNLQYMRTVVVGMVQVRGGEGRRGGSILILLLVLVLHSFYCGVVGASISLVAFHTARSCATMCQCSGSVSLVIVDESVPLL